MKRLSVLVVILVMFAAGGVVSTGSTAQAAASATIEGHVTHGISGLPIENLPVDYFLRDTGYIPPLFIHETGTESNGRGDYAMDVPVSWTGSVSFGWRWGDVSDIEYFDDQTDQQLGRIFRLADGDAVTGVDAVVGLAWIELLMDRLIVIDAGSQWHRWGRLAEHDPRIVSYYFGDPGDLPFAGDWDCDGEATPGLYRQSDGYVYLRNSNTQGVADVAFFFGNPGDVPIAGDFNGDGCDTVSIYRPAEGRFYIINTLGSNDGGLGSAEFSFLFGDTGDKPFVGDFDGSGVDEIGLHRESSGRVYFRTSLTQGRADFDFVYGDPGDILLTGDWNLDGADSVAVYRPSTGNLHLRRANAAGNADYTIHVGEYPSAVILRDGVAHLAVHSGSEYAGSSVGGPDAGGVSILCATPACE